MSTYNATLETNIVHGIGQNWNVSNEVPNLFHTDVNTKIGHPRDTLAYLYIGFILIKATSIAENNIRISVSCMNRKGFNFNYHPCDIISNSCTVDQFGIIYYSTHKHLLPVTKETSDLTLRTLGDPLKIA